MSSHYNTFTPTHCEEGIDNILLSQMSFETQSKVPWTPEAPRTSHLLAATSSRGRGRGRRQPLCSPRGIDMSTLSLPVVQRDPTARAFEARLSRSCRNAGEAESLQMYLDILRRADDATEACKVRERTRLRSQPCGPGAKNEQASRIEAKLSRFRKDVYIVALQEELKRLTADFTVLKQFAKTFVQEHGFGANSSDTRSNHYNGRSHVFNKEVGIVHNAVYKGSPSKKPRFQ